MDRGMGVVCTLYVQCQFGCGILKMVGPKMQDFAQESTCSKEIILKQSYNDLWFFKKCQNCTFKVYFPSQKSTGFFQKKKHLRISI